MYRAQAIGEKNGFTFETSWINHPDFVPKINGIWEKLVSGKSVVDVWVIELKRVKKFLKGWGINLKGQTKRYKRVLQEELLVSEQKEESLSLLKNLLDRKTFIQSELLKLLLEEVELYWHKRSNSKWLLEGDLNTDFFHKNANGGKKEKHHFLS